MKANTISCILRNGIHIKKYRRPIGQPLKQLEEKGGFLARDIARESVDSVVTEDLAKVQLVLDEHKKALPDLAYVFIQDSHQAILAHSFNGGFPRDLLSLGSPPAGQQHQFLFLKTGSGSVLDIAVPVKDRGIGVLHLGLSTISVRRAHTSYQIGLTLLVGLILVVGILLAVALSRLLTRPLYALIPVAQAVGRGDLQTRAELRTGGEVGQLGDAINSMIENLAAAKDRLDGANRYNENILQCMNEALFTLSGEGIVQTVNRATCQLLGRDAADLVGHHGGAFLPGDLLQQMMVTLDGDDRAEMIDRESFLRAGDGKSIPVVLSCAVIRDRDGKSIGLVGVAKDISTIRQAKSALRKSERRHRSLFEDSPMPLYQLDLSGARPLLKGVGTGEEHDGELSRLLAASLQHVKLVHVNQAALVLYDAADARAFEGGLRGTFWQPTAPGVMAALARQLPCFEGELIHQTCSGKRIEVLLKASAAPGHGESLDRILVSVTDRTRQKAMEARLAQADRMATVGLLAAGVAHEINNPLAYILHNLQMLEEDLPRLTAAFRRCQTTALSSLDEHAAARFLDGLQMKEVPADLTESAREAASGARRVRDIVRDLRSFSNTADDQLTAVDINEAAECAVNIAFNQIKYRARLEKDYGDIPAVRANEGRIAQVLLNLLVNAAHAIEEGAPAENVIKLRTWEDGGEVMIEVRDTGSGIAPDDVARMFEPFFTTKPAGVGSGLGLSICQSIVSNLGGRIRVSSEVGRGTSIVIGIPAGAGPDDEEVGQQPEQHQPTSRGRVLVVDDEISLGKAIGRMLKSRHEVVLASSGEEGKLLLAEDFAFDAVLCDLMMPGVSGMELHAWVADTHPELLERMIFMTGGAVTQEARRFRGQLPNQLLDKPFTPEVLFSSIDQVINQKHQAQQK